MATDTHTFTCDFSDGNYCTLVVDKNYNMAAKWKFTPNWDLIENEYFQWRIDITKDILEIMKENLINE